MATVLCLDDGTYQFANLKEFLDAHGYDVLLVDDRRIAIDLFAHTSVDAVVLDCHVDGNEDFVTAARMLQPSVPILMLSGYCRFPCLLSTRADACMQKGETTDRLLDTLELIIRSAKYGLVRSVRFDLAA
jgi:DNA-binding response OmpR family regulator